MRTFVAIELPDAAREALGALIQRLRSGLVSASWVRPENIHLTLRFLGDVDEARLGRLADILREAYKGVAPFSVRVAGTGAFPNARRPSVIWAGMEEIESSPVFPKPGLDEPAAISEARDPVLEKPGHSERPGHSEEPHFGLSLVQMAAESAARAIGLEPEERAFLPHLTLARIRDARRAQPLIELLRAEESFRAGEFEVRAITLFSSQLSPQGSIYRRLEVFSFA